MVRLQRGREISLGGAPAIGGRWPAGAAEPTRFELRVERIGESDRHSVIVAGRSGGWCICLGGMLGARSGFGR
jgi:hypothetical protein